MLSTTHRSLACLLIAGGVLTYTPVQGLPPDIHVRNYARFKVIYNKRISHGDTTTPIRDACDKEAISYDKKYGHKHPGYAFVQGFLEESPTVAGYGKVDKDNYMIQWQCNGYWFVYGTDSD